MFTRSDACSVILGEWMPLDSKIHAWFDDREKIDRKNARVIDRLSKIYKKNRQAFYGWIGGGMSRRKAVKRKALKKAAKKKAAKRVKRKPSRRNGEGGAGGGGGWDMDPMILPDKGGIGGFTKRS